MRLTCIFYLLRKSAHPIAQTFQTLLCIYIKNVLRIFRLVIVIKRNQLIKYSYQGNMAYSVFANKTTCTHRHVFDKKRHSRCGNNGLFEQRYSRKKKNHNEVVSTFQFHGEKLKTYRRIYSVGHE